MNVSVKFYLKRPKSDKSTAIIAKVRLNGKTFKYYTGKSILPPLWDSESGRPTKSKRLINSYSKDIPNIAAEMANIHSVVNKVENYISGYINLNEQNGIAVTEALLRKHLDEKLGRENNVKSGRLTLNAYITKFIEDLESGRRLTDKKSRYAKGTIKNYKGFKVQFEAFQDHIGRQLNFGDITLDFYNDFVAYFQEKRYTPNTIGRHVKTLKVIMRAAMEEGLHENRDFERRKFRVITTNVDSIYLTEEEIERFRKVDLSKKPAQDLARDVFLICCYTALRYSDASQLRPENLKKRNDRYYLEVITQKTGEKVIIPVRPQLKNILDKHEGSIPSTHEQKVNRYIKEVGKMAGLTEIVEIEEYIGNEKIIRTYQKYQLIKTHTGRRSAATNMYLNKIPTLDIMKITGHTTEKAFLKYIRVTKEETANLLAEHAFFN